MTVTAEELAGKYRMNLESLVIFFGAYVDFIELITNSKTNDPVLPNAAVRGEINIPYRQSGSTLWPNMQASAARGPRA